MKTLLIIFLATVWICFSGFFIYFLGLHGSTRSKWQKFNSDNVFMNFEYPADWVYKLEGDLTDLDEYRLITLTDKSDQVAVMVRQFPTSKGTNLCEIYNDCMFQNGIEPFRIKSNEFSIISNKYSVVFPSESGVDYSWDSEGNTILSSTPPQAGTGYYVYSALKGQSDIYTTHIRISENLEIELSYQIDKFVDQQRIDKVKEVIVRILDTIK